MRYPTDFGNKLFEQPSFITIYHLFRSCPCLFMGSSQLRISCWCLPPWSFWLRMRPAHRPRHTWTEEQNAWAPDVGMVVGPSPERISGKHRSMDVRCTLAIWCSWSLECKVTLPAALILARELGVSSLREWAQQHRPQADSTLWLALQQVKCASDHVKSWREFKYHHHISMIQHVA